MQIDKATACMTAWKNDEQLAYAVEVIAAGRRLYADAVPFFGPDDVPESDHGLHLPGIVFRMLAQAGIIEPYYGTNVLAGIKYGRRVSKHERRNGAKVQLYNLVNTGLADAFLQRHGAVAEKGQMELVM